MSASLLTGDSSGCSAPCEVFFTCRSPTAARRVVCLLFSSEALESVPGAICMPTGLADLQQFYLRTMEALRAAGLPFLVGGGYALGHYTGVVRDAKDFDIFVRREDYDSIMKVLSQAGFTPSSHF